VLSLHLSQPNSTYSFLLVERISSSQHLLIITETYVSL
jgi:hypothetical protein